MPAQPLRGLINGFSSVALKRANSVSGQYSSPRISRSPLMVPVSFGHLLGDHGPFPAITPRHRAAQPTLGVEKRHRDPVDLRLDDDRELIDLELLLSPAEPRRQLIGKRHRLTTAIAPIG
jgi:hypothetical protein